MVSAMSKSAPARATKKKYPVIIEGLFDKSAYAAIRNFVSDMVPLLRPHVDNTDFIRYQYHNVPFFKDIHSQLSEFASDIFGEKVKPSYSFLSCYKDGGRCPLHIDRPQCKYTIDYLIRSTSKKPWAINISDYLADDELKELAGFRPDSSEKIEKIIETNKWLSVALKENDAVLYSGTNSWHYRPEVLSGEADLVFFHFVPEAFSERLD